MNIVDISAYPFVMTKKKPSYACQGPAIHQGNVARQRKPPLSKPCVVGSPTMSDVTSSTSPAIAF